MSASDELDDDGDDYFYGSEEDTLANSDEQQPLANEQPEQSQEMNAYWQ